MRTPGEPYTKDDSDELFDLAMEFCRCLEEDTHGPADGIAVISIMLARLACEPAVVEVGGVPVMFAKLRSLTERVAPHVETLVLAANKRKG